jgi:outer membrane lipoprotein LolB
MKKFVIIILTLILTGCATLPASQSALNQHMSWPARQAQLKQLTSWHIAGATAIQTPQQALSASMTWQQQQQHYQIALFGPLGAGRVSLSGGPGNVTLLANGKQYTAQSPEIIMQEVLGWQLPVNNLFYWVRGLPAPHLPSTPRFDAFHHLTQLRQQGWKIDYLRYTTVNNVDLPSLIKLQHADLIVKMVISHW